MCYFSAKLHLEVTNMSRNEALAQTLGEVVEVSPHPSLVLGRTVCLFLKCHGQNMDRVIIRLREYAGAEVGAVSGGKCKQCGALAAHVWLPDRSGLL